MTIKELNRDDLLNRNPGFILDETVIDSETLVQFLDTGLNIVTSYQNQSVDVCYKKIREKKVGDETILFQLTTAQKNALTATVTNQKIYDLTNKQAEVYNGSFWQPIGSLRAFGSMFEDNSSGSTISSASSYEGWTTAIEGEVDNLGLVAFVGNSTADRLETDIGGAGRYFVAFNASFTNDGGKMTTAAIHLNDNEEVSIKATEQGDSSKQETIAAANIIDLDDGEYIDLRFMSENSDDIHVYNVSVTMFRMGI